MNSKINIFEINKESEVYSFISTFPPEPYRCFPERSLEEAVGNDFNIQAMPNGGGYGFGVGQWWTRYMGGGRGHHGCIYGVGDDGYGHGDVLGTHFGNGFSTTLSKADVT